MNLDKLKTSIKRFFCTHIHKHIDTIVLSKEIQNQLILSSDEDIKSVKSVVVNTAEKFECIKCGKISYKPETKMYLPNDSDKGKEIE